MNAEDGGQEIFDLDPQSLDLMVASSSSICLFAPTRVTTVSIKCEFQRWDEGIGKFVKEG